jgi:hypothetical protein
VSTHSGVVNVRRIVYLGPLHKDTLRAFTEVLVVSCQANVYI